MRQLIHYNYIKSTNKQTRQTNNIQHKTKTKNQTKQIMYPKFNC